MPKVRFKEALNNKTTGYTLLLCVIVSQNCNVISNICMRVFVCVSVLCELFLCLPSIVYYERKKNACIIHIYRLLNSIMHLIFVFVFVWVLKTVTFLAYCIYYVTFSIASFMPVCPNQFTYLKCLNTDIFKKISEYYSKEHFFSLSRFLVIIRKLFFEIFWNQYTFYVSTLGFVWMYV